MKGEDGKDHWHIKSWKHNYQTKTGAKFDFQNLFNGNKVLGKLRTIGKHTYLLNTYLSGIGTLLFVLPNIVISPLFSAGPVVDFVNSNWPEVMKEVAPPIVHAIVEKVVEAVDALYKAVPADELMLA